MNLPEFSTVLLLTYLGGIPYHLLRAHQRARQQWRTGGPLVLRYRRLVRRDLRTGRRGRARTVLRLGQVLVVALAPLWPLWMLAELAPPGPPSFGERARRG